MLPALGRGTTGIGYTKSFVSSVQYSRSSLYKYHCRAASSPAEEMTGGRSFGEGRQALSRRRGGGCFQSIA